MRREYAIFAYFLNLSFAWQTHIEREREGPSKILEHILWHNQICFKPKPTKIRRQRRQPFWSLADKTGSPTAPGLLPLHDALLFVLFGLVIYLFLANLLLSCKCTRGRESFAVFFFPLPGTLYIWYMVNANAYKTFNLSPAGRNAR